MRPRINILLHGVPKSGKSLFGVRRNPGAVVLDTEGSTRLIKGIDRREIGKMSDMDAVLDEIKQGKIKLVIIDTLDELVNNFGKYEAKHKSSEFVNKMGMLSLPGWGYLRDRFLQLTRAYRDAGADVLTICHSELYDLPNGTKKWAMKLPSDYSREVMGMMDVVGFSEIALSGKDRVFRVNFSPSPMFDAGLRAIYDATTDKIVSPLPEYLEGEASVLDVLKAYDDFFTGEGKGYAVKCAKCMTAEATEQADNGKNYCPVCHAAYKEWKANKLANTSPATEEVTKQ